MAANLPIELQAILQQYDATPVELVDPATNRVYVLITQEQFERLRPLLDNNTLSKDEQRQLLSDAGRRAGWNDPEMDVYDHYARPSSDS